VRPYLCYNVRIITTQSSVDAEDDYI
jgi:hypothetical protein